MTPTQAFIKLEYSFVNKQLWVDLSAPEGSIILKTIGRDSNVRRNILSKEELDDYIHVKSVLFQMGVIVDRISARSMVNNWRKYMEIE